MKLKETAIFIAKHQLILALIVGIICINFNDWRSDGVFYLILIVLLYQIPVIAGGIFSLFSKQSDYEGLLERSMKSTRPFVIVISIPFMLIVTLPVTPIVPFPSSWVLYLSLFGVFYAIGVSITQRVGLGMIGRIVLAEESSVFGQMIRFATAIHFYPVYLTFSRISSLPGYVRKPVGLIVSLSWLGFMFFIGAIFDK